MRILMLTDGMDIGGAETHILTLCAALVRRGDTVTLMAEPGRLVEKAKKAGVRFAAVDFRKRTPVAILRHIGEVKKRLADADAVHTHTRYTHFLVGWLIRPDLPHITTAHLCFGGKWRKMLTPWGDAVLAVSEDIRDYLIRDCAVASERVFLTQNGIEPTARKKRENGRAVLHISRLDRDRSLTAALLVGLEEKFAESGIRVTVIGDGDDMERLKALKRKKSTRVGGYVLFKGGSADPCQFFSDADLFVGVSRAALEAGCAGMPVILCGNEGYGGFLSRETLTHAEKTNLCARGDGEATAEKLYADVCRFFAEQAKYEREAVLLAPILAARHPADGMAQDVHDAIRCASRIGKAILIGYFGHGNLGDEATLTAAEKLLSEAGLPYVVARRGKIFPHALLPLLRSLGRRKALVFAGGNLLQDETSRRSLLYYLWLIRLAKKRGAKVIFLSSGIGALSRRGERLCRKVLPTVEYFGARTEADLSLARSLGVRRAARMPDLCFLFPLREESKRDLFAVIPRCGGRIDRTMIETVKKNTGLSPIIVVFFPKEDLPTARRLGCLTVCPRSVEEARDVLAPCRFSIAERLHGAVFSLLSSTAVYLSPSTGKARALLDAVSAERDDPPLRALPEKYDKIKEFGTNRAEFRYIIAKWEECIRDACDDIIS